jgi:hypothetical protein
MIMNELENWLKQATSHLSRDAAAKVRAEITEHFEASCEAAIAAGTSPQDAERQAIAALGDPRLANCDYRGVLLTADEARVLREGSREARAVCSRAWIKPALVAGYLVILATAATFALTGHSAWATDAVLAAFGISPFVGAPFLRIDTPARGLAFRIAKWIALGTATILINSPNVWRYSWLVISCLGPIAVIEITRASIRRKLPVQSWPRHLYL